jgi:hypothetical protein
MVPGSREFLACFCERGAARAALGVDVACRVRVLCERSCRARMTLAGFLHSRRPRDVPLLTARRRSRDTGGTNPWIVETAAMVNHYYFYCVDEDFRPFFLKSCSYFPYDAKLCINSSASTVTSISSGSLPSVAFEALDNGIKSCAAP